MINKDIILAQLDLYKNGREQAILKATHAEAALEAARAEVNAFSGSIEACQSFLNIEQAFEREELAKKMSEKTENQKQEAIDK